MPATPTHHSDTVEGTWDAGTHVGRLPSPMSTSAAEHMYGWYDGTRVEDGEIVKDACKLPHHEVSTDGNPGAANLNGVRNALSRLPQSDIPSSDHDAVRAHLEAHLDDADDEQDDRTMTPARFDLRAIPDEVRERLTAGFGHEALSVPHRGFDISYRGKLLEHRATPRVEVRQDEEGHPEIVGYATVYEAPYEVWGGPPWGWTETIAAGSCDRSVREQDEVYCFFDHEGLPLGATKAETLTLASDKIGLYNRTLPDPASPWSMEIVSRLNRGELDAMSFAFRVLRQEWNDDYTERRILEAKLYDVSVVSFPANPATVVGLRAATVAEDLVAVEPPRRGMSLSLARAQAEALSLSR